jgi:hypothetical protein
MPPTIRHTLEPHRAYGDLATTWTLDHLDAYAKRGIHHSISVQDPIPWLALHVCACVCLENVGSPKVQVLCMDLSSRTAYGLQTDLRAESWTTTRLFLFAGEPWRLRTTYSWNADTRDTYGVKWLLGSGTMTCNLRDGHTELRWFNCGEYNFTAEHPRKASHSFTLLISCEI